MSTKKANYKARRIFISLSVLPQGFVWKQHNCKIKINTQYKSEIKYVIIYSIFKMWFLHMYTEKNKLRNSERHYSVIKVKCFPSQFCYKGSNKICAPKISNTDMKLDRDGLNKVWIFPAETKMSHEKRQQTDVGNKQEAVEGESLCLCRKTHNRYFFLKRKPRSFPWQLLFWQERRLPSCAPVHVKRDNNILMSRCCSCDQ